MLQVLYLTYLLSPLTLQVGFPGSSETSAHMPSYVQDLHGQPESTCHKQQVKIGFKNHSKHIGLGFGVHGLGFSRILMKPRTKGRLSKKVVHHSRCHGVPVSPVRKINHGKWTPAPTVGWALSRAAPSLENVPWCQTHPAQRPSEPNTVFSAHWPLIKPQAKHACASFGGVGAHIDLRSAVHYGRPF